MLKAGVLGPAQGVAAVEATVFGERVVAAPELARDLLVGGSAPADQHHVEPGQPKDRDEQERDDADQNNGDDHVSLVEDLLVFQNVYEGKNKYGSHVNGQGYQEHEKVSVVTTSDAVVDPRAVMVKDLDTVVADGAMRAPWWSVELARDTPLHPNGDAIDLYVLVEGCPEVVVLVFVGLGPRDHPRVHERGQAKVHHHEQGDQALVH